MSSYSGGSGHDIFGAALDTKPVDPGLQKLWPPGTFGASGPERAPGGKQMPSRSLIHPGGDQGKKRKKRRPAKKAAK
jgi:hypothetical protein